MNLSFFLENFFCSKVFSEIWRLTMRYSPQKIYVFKSKKIKHYIQNYFLFFTFNRNIWGGFILLKSKIWIKSFSCREDRKKPPVYFSLKFSSGKQTKKKNKNIYKQCQGQNPVLTNPRQCIFCTDAAISKCGRCFSWEFGWGKLHLFVSLRALVYNFNKSISIGTSPYLWEKIRGLQRA